MAIIELKDASPLKPTTAPSAGLVAGAGAVVGVAALAASSCCVLPMALAGLGATGAVFSSLEFLADNRPALLVGAAITLALGWALFFARRRRPPCGDDGQCRRPATIGLASALLGLGSVAVGLATVWEPYVEPALLKFVR